jgi:hypothetical protein
VAEFQRHQQHASAFERAAKLCAAAISGGWHQTERRMRLEVVGRLPKGTVAILEMSLERQLLQV